MLEELRISNFAIIESLELSLHAGLNVITGETGAGKSIIIDAVELLLGGKAEAMMIRAGADKAVLEGTFVAGRDVLPLVAPILEREELTHPDDPALVVLTREIRRNGRSTGRINGTVAKLALMAEIGGYLVDIHGQSEHLSLLRPRIHIDLLDRYANLLEMREAVGTLVGRLGDLRSQIKTLEEDKDELERRADQLRREVQEIDAAALEPDEDDELRSERTRLANSEQLATLTQEASILLNGDDEGDILAAVDGLQQVAILLGKLAAIDEDLEEDAELAESLADQAAELSLNLRGYAEEVEHDPDRLNFIEERLELINGLRRRYGITIEHVLEHAEAARAQLDDIDNSDERLEILRAEEDEMLHHIGELCERISAARQEAAARIAAQIETELGDLRMADARFEVLIEQHENPKGAYVGDKRYQFDVTGIDDVEFMMSANPGEPLQPLAKVASGGETARIMLALKRALTLADPTDTLIFDEIDQGIGGRLGSVVGEKLWNLSGKHQVMVVTHLAQLAGFADSHYRAEKRVENDRTLTLLRLLSGDDERTLELAEMLGTTGDSGEQTARDLLAAARGYKETANTAG
jgi:DNA repair protein RecN (Recombination protein N)